MLGHGVNVMWLTLMFIVSLPLGAAQVQDPADGKHIKVEAVADFGDVDALCFGRAGDEVVCCINQNVVVYKGLRKATSQVLYKHDARIVACAVNGARTFCATADEMGHVIIWDLAAGKVVLDKYVGKLSILAAELRAAKPGSQDETLARATFTLEVAWERVKGLAFSPINQELLVYGGGVCEPQIRLWRGSDWSQEVKFEGHKLEVLFAEVVGSPPLLISGSLDSTVRWLDISSKKLVRSEGKPQEYVVIDGPYPASCAVGGNTVAIGWKRMLADRVDVYDASSWEKRVSVSMSKYRLSALACVDDGFIVIAGTDSSLRVWDVVRNKDVDVCFPVKEKTISIRISKDRKTLLGKTETGIAFLCRLSVN